MLQGGKTSMGLMFDALFCRPAGRVDYVGMSLKLAIAKAIHDMRMERGLKVHHLRRLWGNNHRGMKSYNDVMQSHRGDIEDYLLLAYLLGYQLEFSLARDSASEDGVVIVASYKKLS